MCELSVVNKLRNRDAETASLFCLQKSPLLGASRGVKGWEVREAVIHRLH